FFSYDKVVFYGIIRLILPYFPGVFTDIYYLFPLNSMTLPSQGGDKRGGKKLAKTCPHENGEKKFLHTNTINGKTVQ
ncbi:MAG: hypothetical protein Q7J76_04000, partial [Candidatus Brocadiaceae bacterium]|nr:hypothetical protein [Candidatus Brocadiaceae bacterium]